MTEFLQRFTTELSAGSMIALAVAIAAGMMASAVCPCTVPVGLGMAGAAGASETQSRRSGFIIALAFFAGIVVNLTVLGALASRLGAVLTESFGRYWTLGMATLSLGAAVVAFLGPRLRASQLAALRSPGVGGAFFYGFIFSLGTSAAPLLVLLTIAASQAGTAYGVLLSFAFGIGRGLPFLVAALFAGAITRFARIGLWRRSIQTLSGIALLLVSV
ncbi:MAG: thiol:disulfide interchange protein, partial [Verrucomicrobiota bacterium]|nr:thiol:disulfide interchange protein [Verrucomicrobiota bacterium]